MTRIGILTYFHDDNPGTFLQAYAMQQALTRHFAGSRVEVINYRAWQSIWRPNLSHITLAQWASDFRRFQKYRACRTAFALSQPGLVNADPERAWAYIARQGYDAIFVGSDTVLELHRAAPERLTAFWLSPAVARARVLCAASCRSTTYEGMSEAQRAQARASLTGFCALGARDQATMKLLRQLVPADDARLTLVPDPTVTYAIDYAHADRYLAARGIPRDRPLVALHLTRQFHAAREVAERFRREGYFVLSLRPAEYADAVVYDMSPFEYAGLFRHCRLLITHRFHDTIFALKNQIPVLTMVPDRQMVTRDGDSKYASLLAEFGLARDSYLDDPSAATGAMIFDQARAAMAAFDPEAIRTRLNEHRDAFAAFIDQAGQRIGC